MSDDPDPADSYLEPAAPAEYEERIRRSRFIARVLPLDDRGEVEGLLNEQRKVHRKASHLCYAWRCGPPDSGSFHFSDAGEPGGTAGRPIFQAVETAGLWNLLLVVIRYFGGIKLGAGGLSRAYGGVAARCLEACPTRRVVPREDLRLAFEYSLMTRVRRLLASAGAEEKSLDCAERIQMEVLVPRSARAVLLARLGELFQGRGEIG